jgi:excisionase family DNA binding protein
VSGVGALMAELTPDELRDLAAALAPYMPAPREDDRWLTSAEAAEYLGLSGHALHHLTAARAIPFAQDGPGAKCYFKRSELDHWRSLQSAEKRYNMQHARCRAGT